MKLFKQLDDVHQNPDISVFHKNYFVLKNVVGICWKQHRSKSGAVSF
jgi:hypothetical protein